MSLPTDRNDSEVDQAERELARLQRQIVEERAQLADLQQQVKAQAQARRGSDQRTRLADRAATDPGVQAQGPDAGWSLQLVGDHALAMAEHERQHSENREANTQLVGDHALAMAEHERQHSESKEANTQLMDGHELALAAHERQHFRNREANTQLLDGHLLVLAEHDRQHTQQQEANTHLVLAALGAQDLQAAAEDAQRRQREFLAVLAHELRNPLAPIRTAATLLGMMGDDETRLPQLQAVIERQVTHMSRLVSDLLDLSRVSTGKLRLERRSVDLAGLINQVVDGCRPAIAARAQSLGVHLPARALQMHGDPVRLAQIFGNLLDNASKYTPHGGEIQLEVEATDDEVTITVSDNGIGITAAALPDVFKPFAQDPHATGFNGAGFGIGLTVVHELVEAHGGSVSAASDGTGLGSRFVVTLPLAGELAR